MTGKENEKYNKVIAEKVIELAGMKIRVGISEFKQRGFLIRKPYASKVITDSVPILQAEIRKLQRENEKLKLGLGQKEQPRIQSRIIRSKREKLTEARQNLLEILKYNPMKIGKLVKYLMKQTKISEPSAKRIIREAKTKLLIKKENGFWNLTGYNQSDERGLKQEMVFEKVIKTYGGTKEPNMIRFSKNTFSFHNFDGIEQYTGSEIYIDKETRRIGFKFMKSSTGDCYGIYKQDKSKGNVYFTNKGKLKNVVLTQGQKKATFQEGMWICDNMDFA